jgi:Ser/Thr protein kinase RdoA (MazF antagonist)
VDRQLAAQVADRFDLGPDARLEVEAARGEQGQVRRLDTARGTFALKETFGEVDVAEAEATAAFQARCHEAGIPCPRPVPDVDGRFVAVVEGEALRVQTWVDIHDPDPRVDPGLVGDAVARLHAVDVPGETTPHEWFTEPVGATEWQALVKAARGAGAPFAERLAALVPHLLAAEALLTPMAGLQWLHLDLWADNLRGTPHGSVCVIDFDNAGPGDPTRELAMVLFEFARTDAARVAALVAAYDAAGGPGRVTRAEDFAMTIAQLHHIGRYQVLGWLHAQDPEARARAHAGVREFVDDPLTVEVVERLVGWVAGKTE